MATDRFPLLPGPDGQEQYAMIERRPTRGQLKEVGRRNRQAEAAGDPLEGHHWMIVTLCDELVVYDADGNPVPKRTGKAMDDVPADVLQPLINELRGVIASVDRGGAMEEITTTLRNMAWTLDENRASRLQELLGELHEVFGVTPPNASGQAAT